MSGSGASQEPEEVVEAASVDGDRVIELVTKSPDAYEREARVEERPFTAADNQQMEARARRTIAYILSGILVALVLGFIVIALFCDSSEERLTSYTAAAAPYTTLIAAVTTYYFTRQSRN